MLNDYNSHNHTEQDAMGRGPAPQNSWNFQTPSPEQKPHKERSPYMTKKMGAVVMALCILAAGSAGFAGGVLINGTQSEPTQTVLNNDESSTTPVQHTALNVSSSASGEDLMVSQIAAQTANSVVEITTEATSYDIYMRQSVSEGAGSGVILTSDGYIATNNHVINGASKITVTLKDGTSYPATLVGTDSQGDVAVIKIDASGLQPAVIGDSSELQVGDLAVAVGNPLGQLGGTVTDGIISALDRQIDLDGRTMTLLQTNAAINPGNSGGGLFNSKGELIGIVVAKSSGSGIEGLGFAIPINTAKDLIDQIMEYGYVKGRIDLGMTTVDVSNAQVAMMYRLPSTGVYIDEVTEGSNAEAAGFRSGDRILSFNGEEISSGSDLAQALQNCQVGDAVEIIIVRNGQKYSGSLTLEESKPASAN